MFYDILALIVAIIAVILAGATAPRSYSQAQAQAQSRTGGARSQLEADIIKNAEDILHVKFDTAHPEWLKIDGAVCELDGYNAELKVAFEVQGPQHFKPMAGEPYETYERRIKKDERKRTICAKHGVALIIVDYELSPSVVRDYIRSRLWDAHIPMPSYDQRIKPPNYLAPIQKKPWHKGDK